MKKLVILAVACLFLAGWGVTGYCQDEGGFDSGESSEQSLDSGLESEIGEDQSESESGIDNMELSMDTGGATN